MSSKPDPRDSPDASRWQLARRLFEGTSIGFIMFRPDMTIEWINVAAAGMLGEHAPEEVIGRGLYDVAPYMRERKPIHDRVLAGEDIDLPNAEIVLAHETRNYDIHYRPKFDGDRRVDGFVVIVYEITRQQRAESTLMETEEKFRTLYDATPDMLLAEELPSRKIVECNRTLCRILGYSREELIGMTVFDLYAPDCWPRALEAFETLRDVGRVAEVELQVRGKDGTIVDIELSSTAFRDCDFKIVGTRAVWHDITARKAAELKLLRSEEQLRELSRKILEVQEEERRSLSREFHDEVGQVFTGLRMDLAWIRSRLAPDQDQLLRKIGSMDHLIDEAIQRVRRIARALRPDVLDKLGLVAAIEGQVSDFETRSGIACKLEVSPPEFVVEPQIATTVFRILQEALTNIARHAEATTVHVLLRREPGKLRLGVQDNGKGVADSELSNDSSLGLRGMRERARLLGGRVSVSAVAASGTKVVVTIPIDDEQE